MIICVSSCSVLSALARAGLVFQPPSQLPVEQLRLPQGRAIPSTALPAPLGLKRLESPLKSYLAGP